MDQVTEELKLKPMAGGLRLLQMSVYRCTACAAIMLEIVFRVLRYRNFILFGRPNYINQLFH